MVKKYLYDSFGNYSICLKAGIYRFHCCGASGGYLELNGSRGAYVSGVINLNESRRFFVYVGEKGVVKGTKETYNGGGKSSYSDNYYYKEAYSSSGGGGTDIRLIGGDWYEFESLKSRIIVAGGGGGETNFINDGQSRPALGGSAGIFVAESSNYSDLYNHQNFQCRDFLPTTGGSQKSGGKSGGTGSGLDGEFGKGGNGELWNDNAHSSGSGGGYFGGGGAGISHCKLGCGSGGSSFVSGVEGFSAMTKDSTSSNYSFDGTIHYSGLIFTNPTLHSGKEYFISPHGALERGHSGDGAVLIEQLNLLLTCRSKLKINIITQLILICINISS